MEQAGIVAFFWLLTAYGAKAEKLEEAERLLLAARKEQEAGLPVWRRGPTKKAKP